MSDDEDDTFSFRTIEEQHIFDNIEKELDRVKDIGFRAGLWRAVSICQKRANRLKATAEQYPAGTAVCYVEEDLACIKDIKEYLTNMKA